MAASVSCGWGMIPVTAQIRETRWKTSTFPKAGVRRAEGLDVGEVVTVRLAVGP